MDESRVARVELLLLIFLVGKRLCHTCAGDGAFDVRVDFRNALLYLQRGTAHFYPQPHHVVDRGRNNAEQPQRKPPIDERHRNKRAKDGGSGDEHILRAVMREFGDVKQIRRHAGHELAGSHLVEKAERELLNVRKDIAANVRLHADAQHMPPVVDDKQQQRAHEIGAERSKNQQHKHAKHCAVERHLRQERAQNILRKQRVGNVDQRDEKRAGEIEDQQALVGLVVG